MSVRPGKSGKYQGILWPPCPRERANGWIGVGVHSREMCPNAALAGAYIFTSMCVVRMEVRYWNTVKISKLSYAHFLARLAVKRQENWF